jgi:hypothetical protein
MESRAPHHNSANHIVKILRSCRRLDVARSGPAGFIDEDPEIDDSLISAAQHFAGIIVIAEPGICGLSRISFAGEPLLLLNV